MRHTQFFKSAGYVGFGIGTLVGLLPYLIRKSGVEVLAFDAGPIRWFGVAIVAVGAAAYFSCAWDFSATGKGTPAFWDPPRRFILNRWFWSVRNPMYGGVALMIVGQGVYFGSTAIVLYALVVTFGFHLFVVGYEEPALRRAYGDRYGEYCARVPRWIPVRRRAG